MESNGTSTLTERHCCKKSENRTRIDKADAEISAERAESLRAKWRAHRDKLTVGKEPRHPARRLFTWYTVFMAVSFLYCAHRFWAERYFSEHGELAPYYFKVLTTFLTVQAFANWMCTICYDTTHRASADRPDVVKKSLWDDTVNDSDTRNQPTKSAISTLTEEAQQKLKKEIDNLSWRFCTICDQPKPPRAHHCKVCNKCILQRGHHCYITGVCVGYYNQRYFAVFTFYTVVTGSILGYFTFHYLRDTFYENSSIFDYILPITIYKWLAGYYEHQYVLCVIFLYSVWWVVPMTTSLLCHEVLFIYKGMTPHEYHTNLSIKNTNTLQENLKSVFGAFWFLNFTSPQFFCSDKWEMEKRSIT